MAADPRVIAERLKGLTPVAARMSPGRRQEMCSGVRSLCRAAGLQPESTPSGRKARSGTRKFGASRPTYS
jgi:hypothetical protein